MNAMEPLEHKLSPLKKKKNIYIYIYIYIEGILSERTFKMRG